MLWEVRASLTSVHPPFFCLVTRYDTFKKKKQKKNGWCSIIDRVEVVPFDLTLHWAPQTSSNVSNLSTYSIKTPFQDLHQSINQKKKKRYFSISRSNSWLWSPFTFFFSQPVQVCRILVTLKLRDQHPRWSGMESPRQMAASDIVQLMGHFLSCFIGLNWSDTPSLAQQSTDLLEEGLLYHIAGLWFFPLQPMPTEMWSTGMPFIDFLIYFSVHLHHRDNKLNQLTEWDLQYGLLGGIGPSPLLHTSSWMYFFCLCSFSH